VRAYAALFADPANGVAATGFRNACVLVVTTTATRRDRLWEAIEQIGTDMGLVPEILESFWVVEKDALRERTLGLESWRVPEIIRKQSLFDNTYR
jgi:hypothetical protein